MASELAPNLEQHAALLVEPVVLTRDGQIARFGAILRADN
jgi:hypothetical protein